MSEMEENGRRKYFMINLCESMGLGRDLATPGSAVRYVTDCTTQPSKCYNEIMEKLALENQQITFVPLFDGAYAAPKRHNNIILALSLIQTPFNALANRADPDQAALVRAV